MRRSRRLAARSAGGAGSRPGPVPCPQVEHVSVARAAVVHTAAAAGAVVAGVEVVAAAARVGAAAVAAVVRAAAAAAAAVVGGRQRAMLPEDRRRARIGLKVITLNVGGIGSKAAQIEALMDGDVAVAVLTDTGLASEAEGLALAWDNSDRLSFLHYGDAGKSAGVGLLVDTGYVTAKQVGQGTPAGAVPSAVGWWEVRGCGVNLVICGVYLAPRYRYPLHKRCRPEDPYEAQVLAAVAAGLEQFGGGTAEVLVMGDFNAHVGTEGGLGPRHQQHKVRPINPEGRRLLDFLQLNDLYIQNGATLPHVLTQATTTFHGKEDPEDLDKRKTMLDLVLCSAETAELVLDVHVQGSGVPTNHRVVVVELGGSGDEVRAARLRSARMHLGDIAPRAPGVLHPVYRLYGYMVNRELLELESKYFPAGMDLMLEEAPCTRHLTRKQLASMYRDVCRALLAHYGVVLEVAAMTPYEAPSRQALDAAKRHCVQLKRRVSRLRAAAKRAVATSRNGAVAVAAVAALAGAEEAKRVAAAVLRREQADLARRVREARHEVVRTALYSANLAKRNQKLGHAVLIKAHAQGRRHGAGMQTFVERLQRTDGSLTSTDAEVAAEFSQHHAELFAESRATADAPAEPTCDPPPPVEVMEDLPFTTEEVGEAMVKLKHHKAAGVDRVSATMLRACDVKALKKETGEVEPESRRLVFWMAAMCTEAARQGWVPKQLAEGRVKMLPKPGKPDYSVVSAYRSITVLTSVRKLMEQVVGTRVMTHLERHERMGETQAAYRPGRSCVDHLLALAAVERARAHAKVWCPDPDTGERNSTFCNPGTLVPDLPAGPRLAGVVRQRPDGGYPDQYARVVMLDLATAFDLADWDVMFNRLHAAGVTGRSAQLMRAIYRCHSTKVQVGRARGRRVRPSRGTPQGGVTSPTLFSLAMTSVAAEVGKALLSREVRMDEPLDMNSWPAVEGQDMDEPHVVYSGPLALLLLADDLTIMAKSAEDMDLCVRAVVKAIHMLKGKINLAKSVHLVPPLPTRGLARWWPPKRVTDARRPIQWYRVADGVGGALLVAEGAIPQHAEHKYLGVVVNTDMDFREHRKKAHAATQSLLRRVGAETRTYGVYDPRLTVLALHHAYSGMLFASEVWSSVTLKGSEVMKTRMELVHCGARALAVPYRTVGEFVLGELGLQPPEARLATARLAYWFTLLVQPPHAYTRHAYRLSVATHAGRPVDKPRKETTWAGEMRCLLLAMQSELRDCGGEPTERSEALLASLEGAWADGDAGKQRAWLSAEMVARNRGALPAVPRMTVAKEYRSTRRAVRKMAESLVAEWAEECWRGKVASRKTLRWYKDLQPNLVMARHLDSARDVDTLKLRVKLRANIYPLAAVRGTWGTVAGTAARAEKVRCKLCDADVAEDLPHFLLRCPALAAARGDLPALFKSVCTHPAVLAAVPDEVPEAEGVGERELLALMLGGDLTHLPGLEHFMFSAAEVRRGRHMGPHPATDRLAALRAGGKVLRALHEARQACVDEAGVEAEREAAAEAEAEAAMDAEAEAEADAEAEAEVEVWAEAWAEVEEEGD